MKVLGMVLLLVTLGCRAQDTNSITSKVVEIDREKDGRPESCYETFYRGDKVVMRVSSKLNESGLMAVSSRSYFAAGDLVATEVDQDGDGVFETIAVYRAGTTDMDVFSRQRDGTVRPVDGQTLAAYKKQGAAIAEFWDKTLGEGADVDKSMEMLKETQQSIQAAEKEKTDGER